MKLKEEDSHSVHKESFYPKLPQKSSYGQYLYDYFHRNSDNQAAGAAESTVPVKSEHNTPPTHQTHPNHQLNPYQYYNMMYYQMPPMPRPPQQSPSPTSDISGNSPHTPHLPYQPKPGAGEYSMYPNPTANHLLPTNGNLYNTNSVPPKFQDMKAGQKRGIDFLSMEELVEDLMRKKNQTQTTHRQAAPMFDDKVCERLCQMYEYAHIPPPPAVPPSAPPVAAAPPTITNLDYQVSTNEQLSDVNSLLMQLGREAAESASPSSSEDLFDPATLASLGLSPSESSSESLSGVPSPPTATWFPAIDGSLYPQLEKKHKPNDYTISPPQIASGHSGSEKKVKVPQLTKAPARSIYGLLDEPMDHDHESAKKKADEDEGMDLTLPPIVKAPPSPPTASIGLSPLQIAGALSPSASGSSRSRNSSFSTRDDSKRERDDTPTQATGLDALAIAATANTTDNTRKERHVRAVHVIKALLYTINKDYRERYASNYRHTQSS